MLLSPGGTSFMEDYTYHLGPGEPKTLGAHMLEVCPTIASGQASLEVHPLGIGGREDPARLVFDAAPGPATVIGLAFFLAGWSISHLHVTRISRGLENRNQSLRKLFNLPLIVSAALLSFAHGANDVANAVGGRAIVLGHGLNTRLNPLDEGHRPSGLSDEQWASTVAARRRDLIGALAVVSLLAWLFLRFTRIFGRQR